MNHHEVDCYAGSDDEVDNEHNKGLTELNAGATDDWDTTLYLTLDADECDEEENFYL